MELSEALAHVDSLGFNTEPIDFSELTDEQLLKISITVDLLSVEEARLFRSELERRQLTEKYFSMRKTNHNT